MYHPLENLIWCQGVMVKDPLDAIWSNQAPQVASDDPGKSLEVEGFTTKSCERS